jgi:DNA-nicking Smr family endonuclease
VIPELDLHGFYPDQAENKVDVFLYEHYNKGEDSIRIIYGLGKGIMEETVLAYLDNHPLVAEIKKEVGSCIVVFER